MLFNQAALINLIKENPTLWEVEFDGDIKKIKTIAPLNPKHIVDEEVAQSALFFLFTSQIIPMKTIQEIITRYNELENTKANLGRPRTEAEWLETQRLEEEFTNHPEADDTCTYKGNFVMKSDVSVEDYLNQ